MLTISSRRATICALTLLVAAICVMLAPAAGFASSLGVGGNEAPPPSTGWFAGFFNWINTQQQAFYRSATQALKALRDNPLAAHTLIFLSFAYGVLHAAGPGHGKFVISSFMIANEVALRRGIVLSVLSSLAQAVSAIILVGSAYLLLRGTAYRMSDVQGWLEIASYALIAAFGAWLLWQKLRRRSYGKHEHSHHSPEEIPSHSHAHDHHGHSSCGHDHSSCNHDQNEHKHDHNHTHAHVCETCGHAHAPDAKQLMQPEFSLGKAVSVIFAIGLRPCTGAIIVLSYALVNGLYIGGVLSVFAMALGTAFTVSMLAMLAVYAKTRAVRLYGHGEISARLFNAVEVIGATMILLIGLTLLGGAFAG